MKSKGNEKPMPPTEPYLTKGNVLDDLGFSPEEGLEIKVKADIYRDLLHYIKNQGFTQQELGNALKIHQPDVSNLMNGRISKFSVGKLIKFAGKLNLGAEVRITNPQRVAAQKTAALPVKTIKNRKQPTVIA